MKEDEKHGDKEFKALLKHPNAASNALDTSHKGESVVRFLNQERRAIHRRGAKHAPGAIFTAILTPF